MDFKTELLNEQIDIRQIETLLNEALGDSDFFNEGLLTGRYGKNILEYFVNILGVKEMFRDPNETLFQIIKIQKKCISDSLCDGIIGLLWYLNYLHKSDFIECRVNEEFSERLVMLEHQMESVYKTRGIDFLYGGLGYTFLFLELDYKVEDIVEKSLCFLEEGMISTSEGISWHSIYEGKVINMGLAHGMPSIIRILSMMYKKSAIYKERILFLLKGAIKFMINSKQDINEFDSYFPYEHSKSRTTRLAWCYGDLTVALSIWHAGRIVGIKEWEKEAIGIAKESCKRKSFRNDVLEDLCICHGSSGIAHIYNRFYQYTGIDEFRYASDYWIGVTLKKICQIDIKSKLKGGILEGLSGVCLVLLNRIKEYDMSWDRCLLIS